MRILTAAAATLGVAAGFGASLLMAEVPDGRQRVVYHINGDDRAVHRAALGNIRNHLNTIGDDGLDLRVVLNGDGVSLLRDARDDTDLRAALESLKARNVVFEVCRITLDSRHLALGTDLLDIGVTLVPSGVVALATHQRDGFAYIKP